METASFAAIEKVQTNNIISGSKDIVDSRIKLQKKTQRALARVQKLFIFTLICLPM